MQAWLGSIVESTSLTLEYWTHLPDRYDPLASKLAQGKLEEHQGEARKYHENDVGNQEGP